MLETASVGPMSGYPDVCGADCSAGDSVMCALMTSGGVRCWGHDGANGALGNGGTADHESAVAP